MLNENLSVRVCLLIPMTIKLTIFLFSFLSFFFDIPTRLFWGSDYPNATITTNDNIAVIIVIILLYFATTLLLFLLFTIINTLVFRPALV